MNEFHALVAHTRFGGKKVRVVLHGRFFPLVGELNGRKKDRLLVGTKWVAWHEIVTIEGV